MVRSNRIKFHTFGKTQLTGTEADVGIDAYSDSPINGRIQSVYFEGGNLPAAGSLTLSISGTAAGLSTGEGVVLTMTSGTSTGHHLGEDWVVFPRAKTVSTVGVPTSGGGGTPEVEIPVWSTLRIQAGSFGAGSSASGLTVIYI